MKPFKYGCVVSGENFCPRPMLEKQLQEFARDGQNLVIQGARRMGKTSLVKHALDNMPRWRIVYIDLYCINSLADFCARVMKGIAKVSEDVSFLKKVLQFAFRLRPVIAIDPKDGSTTISIDSRTADQPDSLDAVLSTLEKVAAEGRTCIVFDEFQDVLKLPDSRAILAQMRSTIQFQDKVPYFFTGSLRNEMMSIFDDMDSPFYKSALTFSVDEIDPVDFSAFIADRFKVGGRKIEPGVISEILAFADGVSGDVQQLCEAIWETTEKSTTISSESFSAALELIFSRELRGYEIIMEQLTPVQGRVLQGLVATPHARVFSEEFSSMLKMATSSIRRVLTRLVADRLIYSHKGEYHFSNPFFREWLARQM